MYLIDSRGETCPTPVINLKKALKSGEHDGIRQIVDNELAKENVEKMLTQLNVEFSSKQEGDDFIIDIGDTKSDDMSGGADLSEEIVVISSDEMGAGDGVLGKMLMKNFIYSLTESDKLPSKILLYNSGVKLSCLDQDAVDDLIKLENMGVEIMSCGLCMNHFKIQDQLKVGSGTNMYSILQTMMDAKKIVKP